ncbi:hypothetical protein DP124_01395 [Clostridium tetani]|uniref:phage tail protein n=1 Tax=Clostridium tetani TaxID=1513 RepID=UPI00100B2770|nr:phage tail protein [Clostridium tetani]RXI55552.1 hypothetical protein DP124_01395 [Clostridium tetani]RXM71998.1 hypothetical protein DP143_09330 [Clostridium tetani]
MEQFYTLITDIGKAKIANATALQKKLELSKIVLGDSNGTYYEPTESQLYLKNKVWEGEINDKFIDKNNPNWIVVQTIIPSTIGGFTIREAGIIDADGDLVIVAKYPETYKPKIEDGSTKDITINLVLEVSNVENVTLKVDPTVILATKKDIEVLENKIENIKVPVTSVNSKTGAIELKAEDINCNDGKSVELQLADKADKSTVANIYADKTFTLYVDGRNGNDTTGDGSKNKPYKTLKYAVDKLPSISRYGCTIDVIGDTPVPSSIFFNSLSKSKAFTIESSNGSKLIGPLDSYANIYLDSVPWIEIKNLTLQRVSIQPRFGTYAELRKVVFTDVKFPVYVDYGAIGHVFDCNFTSGVVNCITCDTCSRVHSLRNTGGGSGYGLRAIRGSVISKSETQPTGNVSNESAVNGGVIRG